MPDNRNRKRPIQVKFFVDEKEQALIKKKMEQAGIENMSAYIRKMVIDGYVAKNTFDYFIHKDLRGFLSRELDFFIKSEVMHLEDLDTSNEARVETYLAKVKAIKRVGKIIIDFLAQIEDFQKKLWLKKKFVVETNWCITLDKIDESFWAEIIANKAQIDEWIAMYAIDEADGWSNPPTVEFLRRNLNLIVDTKHFPNTFKFALLESIPNLSEQTNGLMVQGDNIQALSMLQEYRVTEDTQIFYPSTFGDGIFPTVFPFKYTNEAFKKGDIVYTIYHPREYYAERGEAYAVVSNGTKGGLVLISNLEKVDEPQFRYTLETKTDNCNLYKADFYTVKHTYPKEVTYTSWKITQEIAAVIPAGENLTLIEGGVDDVSGDAYLRVYIPEIKLTGYISRGDIAVIRTPVE